MIDRARYFLVLTCAFALIGCGKEVSEKEDSVTLDIKKGSDHALSAPKLLLSAHLHIPNGFHIFGPEVQNVGKPSVLELFEGDLKRDPEIQWPKPKSIVNQTLGFTYEAFEGDVAIPLVLTAVSAHSQIKIVIRYVLCKIQCVPGTVESSIDL